MFAGSAAFCGAGSAETGFTRFSLSTTACAPALRAIPLGCAVPHAYDTLQCPRVTLGRAAADALPTVPRHKVRVRGVETEFCKHGQRIPEWWHFPECDRHYYFAPGDDASSSAPAHAHVIPPLALPLCYVQSAARLLAEHPRANLRACVNMQKCGARESSDGTDATAGHAGARDARYDARCGQAQ